MDIAELTHEQRRRIGNLTKIAAGRGIRVTLTADQRTVIYTSVKTGRELDRQPASFFDTRPTAEERAAMLEKGRSLLPGLVSGLRRARRRAEHLRALADAQYLPPFVRSRSRRDLEHWTNNVAFWADKVHRLRREISMLQATKPKPPSHGPK